MYPTYATFKLIESKSESSATRGCLIYWTVFGLFTLAEGFVDNVLSWVPLYPIARVGFQVWLFSHNFAGAATVYGLAVVPILSKVDALVVTLSEEIAIKAEKQSSK